MPEELTPAAKKALEEAAEKVRKREADKLDRQARQAAKWGDGGADALADDAAKAKGKVQEDKNKK
jgi:hypothetical protein